MSCTSATGVTCQVTGNRCMFLVPNSKTCAEIYGEGPDAQQDRCEDCQDFYTKDGRRACRTRPYFPVFPGDPPKTDFLEDETTSCGGFAHAHQTDVGNTVD